MDPKHCFNLLLQFLFLLFLQITSSDSSSFKLVCYYTNWAIYRPSLAKFTPLNINPYLCTHLIYAFGGISNKFEMKPFDSYNDIQQGNYKKFVDLKKHNSKLKTMIAVGGWNEGSKKFSNMVSKPENRETFIRSAMRFLREHKFDGLDLDWEYPTFRDGSHPEDREGYAHLVQELREAFDDEKLGRNKERLLLSMAVPAGQQYIDQGYDVTSLSRDLDFINLLTYDYYTTQEGVAKNHAPLLGTAEEDLEEWDYQKNLNVDWTVNYYMELGAPAEKLIVGIPAYGRAFQLDEDDAEYGALIKGPAEPGPSTREGGYLAYYEICKHLESDDWKVERPHPEAIGPYAHKGDQWVGYDDENMVIRKAKYVVENKLGGAMFWSLDNDDFRGQCGGEKSPLITAVRKVLFSASSSKSSSSSKPSVPKKVPKTTTTTTTTTTQRPKTTTTTEPEEVEEEELEEEFVAKESPNSRLDPEEEEEVEHEKEQTLKKSANDFGTRRRNREHRTTGEDDIIMEEEEDMLRTPEPPTTPDPGPQFECHDEGFFINPQDCRKYFWCLDSGPADLGVIPHHFTCPSGLFFNVRSDSCDYKENVSCKPSSSSSPAATRKPSRSRSSRPKSSSSSRRTTAKPSAKEEAEQEEEPQSSKAKPDSNIAELLTLIEKLGGVEAVQRHLGKGDEPTKAPEEVPAEEAETTTTKAPPPTLPKRRTHSRHRGRTTTEEPTTTAKRVLPSSSARRRQRTSTAEPTDEEHATTLPSAARRRPIPATSDDETNSKVTATVAPRSSRRRPSSRRTTTEAATAEDAIVDNSRQSTTVQKFQKVDAVEEKEFEARADEPDKSVTDGFISMDDPATGTEVGSNEEVEDHGSFGATQIPGLFKYVVLQRGASTEPSGRENPVAAQLRSILDAHEAKAVNITPSKTESNDNLPEDRTVKEASTNVQVTSLEKVPLTAADEALVQSHDADAPPPPPPPFESIGVHLDYEDVFPSTTTTTPETTTSDLTTSTSRLPATSPESIEPPEATPGAINGPHLQEDYYEYYDELESTTTDLLEDHHPEEEEFLPTTTVAPTTTTTTEASEPTTPDSPFIIPLRPRPRPRPITTTTTTSPPPPPPRAHQRRTTTTTTSAPDTVPISKRVLPANRSLRTTTTTQEPFIPGDGSYPQNVRVKLVRRPGHETQADAFQGLSVDDNGQIECLEQGVYPHPIECNKFVSCVAMLGTHKDYTYTCPHGQLYDDFTGRCLDSELVECYSDAK